MIWSSGTVLTVISAVPVAAEPESGMWVPRSMRIWQPAQVCVSNTRRPGASDGAAGSASRAIQASKSAGASATTRMIMLACCSPQNSAHCPRYTPGSDASSHNVLGWPGIMSVFGPRRGTQKLWMTSSVVSASCTFTPAGMWISLADTAPLG